MRPCIEYLELMNAVLDGEATAAQETELTSHLSLCPACAALYEDLRALREGADGLLVPAPEGFTDAVMDQIRAETAPPKLRVLPKRKTRTWIPAAAMAAVCAIALLGSGTLDYFRPYAGGSAAPALAPDLSVMSVAPSAGSNQKQIAQPAPEHADIQSAQVETSTCDSAANQTPAISNHLLPIPPTSAESVRSKNEDIRPALELVVERTYGGSGYTMQTDYAEDGLSCSVTLLDGEKVIDQGTLSYTGLSPNEKFYCFSWTWEGQSAEDAELFRYAVPLDFSYVMWAGDASDDGQGFRTALEN